MVRVCRVRRRRLGWPPRRRMKAGAASASQERLETTNVSRSRVSLLQYSPAIILLIAVLLNVNQWTDIDPWLRILLGRVTLAQGHLPSRETFSYTAFGHPWWDHEWLTEVIFALIYDKLGVIGLKLLKFACCGAIALLLSATLTECGASATIQLLMLLVTAVGLVPFVQLRPQLFSFVFTIALLALITRDNYRRTAPELWLAVPICMLWANLHGAFFVGLGILGIYAAVVALQELISGRGLWRGIRLSGVTLGAALATLVNPYGFRLWTTVLASSERWRKTGLDVQWQPTLEVLQTQLRTSPGTFVCCAVVLAATAALVILFVMRPQGDDWPLIAVAVVVTASGFAAIRNLPIQAMAIMAPLARRASLVFDPFPNGATREPQRGRTNANQLVIAAIALLTAILVGEFSPNLINTVHTPTGAVTFMRRHDLHGKVLCSIGWAAYFISREAPESKVFIDGREDMAYPMELVGKYAIFASGGPRAAGVLRQYPPDYVLIRVGQPVYRFMLKQRNWRLIYRDNISALFAPADSRAATLKGIPFHGHSGPNFSPL